MDEKYGSNPRIDFTGSGVTVTDSSENPYSACMTPDNFKALFQKVIALEIQVVALAEMLNKSVAQAQEMAAKMPTTLDRRDHQHRRDVRVALKDSLMGVNKGESCRLDEMAGKATTYNRSDFKHPDENRPDFKLKELTKGASGQVLASNGTGWEWTNSPAVVSSTALELLSCSRSDGIPCECCRLTPPKGYQTPDEKRFICSRCYDKGHRLEERK